MRMRRFVLLDRDGTLIAERNYLSRAEDVELLPATARGLRLLNHLGLGLAVLTNQSGLGRGYFDGAALDAIHTHLTRLLAAEGVSLAGIYVCPHTPEDDCDCCDDCHARCERGSGCSLPPRSRQARDPALSEVVRRDVHGATVGGGANRALTTG